MSMRDLRGATPVTVGDNGYILQSTQLVFVKGKFTFSLSGSVKLTVGDVPITKEFIEKLAKEIADSVVLN
jgi:hypothetical protein